MMNNDTTQNQIQVVAAGKTPKIKDARVVVLYDGESGMAITTNTIVTYEGADAVADDAIIKTSMERLETFYREVAGDPVRERKLTAKGRKLCPIGQIKAVISKDFRLLQSEFHVDPRSGALAEGPLKTAHRK